MAHHHHHHHYHDHPLRVQSLIEPHSSDKLSDESMGNKSAQCTVTCVYHAKLVGMCRNVTVVWCKNLINHSLNITVDSPGDENNYTCKIDFKPWHFWTKKGFKPFDVEGKRVDVFWDLRRAKISGSPEPYMDYYVAMVFDEEVVLLLGDYKKKAYKRTKSRPSLADAVLVWKKENVFAKKCFSTRAKFDQRKKDHDIVVENSVGGPRDPEMWISIDGIVLVHITSLQWKFRGNETVLVNKMPVQILWDVHDWLFSTPGSGHGLFIFKPGSPENRQDNYILKDGSSHGGETDRDSTTTLSTDEGQRQPLIEDNTSSNPEFCLFLYAWKIE
ncbi:hypothetical protein IFM89_023910 [Coptis chinensis]|uniref:Ig-like domain-containing protein n=1 Tax=Coptis chinensis TaxID=261450 RepID=A0A835I548_9MAGN|nr:hypothetical protein IFM89_023910 [Coptis chinensis]